ncbi:sugar phosphate isomerase/epimerase (plasmid) [Rhodococcus opacus]|uniref:sugar phosphate isomerase/epimerase family protein n=1 Tax=Rhodococcus opacus TaxID=37919 RepID=UPI0034D1D2E9
MIDSRLGCSTISFRHLELEKALDEIITLGFEEVDLGSLPGVCTHVPTTLTASDVARIATSVAKAGVSVRIWIESLHVFRLCCNQPRAVGLTSRLDPEVGIGMDFSHIVAAGDHPVQFVETFGDRITHVHIRDATRGRIELDHHPIVDEPGNINLSVGRGAVDFDAGISALHAAKFDGHYTLELETRDVTDDERPAAAADAAHLITTLLASHH